MAVEAPGAGSTRKVRHVRTVLLGLPLLTLAALFALTCAYSPPTPHTGDALLDACFIELDQRGWLPWQSQYLANQDPQRLWQFYGINRMPDEVAPAAKTLPASSIFSHVDERFAGDPRYWLMLYYNQHCPVPPQAGVALTQRGLKDRAWFLEEAQRRQAVNVPLLEALLDEEQAPWVAARNAASSGIPVATNAVDKRWPLDFWRAGAAGYRGASAGSLDALLADLLETGRGDAAAYYTAALYESQRGELAKAAQLLAQGNRLPQVSSLRFALDPDGMWLARELPQQTWLVDDMAYGNYLDRMTFDFIPWKNLVNQLAADAAMRNDRAGLQETYTFSCRFARCGEPSLLASLVAGIMSNEPTQALKDFGRPPLDPEELQALGELQTKRDQLRNQFKAQNKLSGQANAFMRNWRWQSYVVLKSTLSCGATDSTALLDLTHQGEVQEVQACQGIFNPLWDELARFDYRTMQFSADPARLR